MWDEINITNPIVIDLLNDSREARVILNQKGEITLANKGFKNLFPESRLPIPAGFTSLDSFTKSLFEDPSEMYRCTMEGDKTLAYDVRPRLWAGQVMLTFYPALKSGLSEADHLTQYYQELTDLIDETVFILDKEGCIIYLSPSWRKHLGLEAEELMGKPFDAFIHPEDVNKVRKYWQELQTGRKALSFEYRLQHRNGNYIWYLSSGTPIEFESGAIRGYIGIALNIDDRKQIEDGIQRSESRYSMFSDLSNEGLMIHQDGVLTDVNLAFARMTGYEKKELEGKNVIERIARKDYHEVIRENIANNYQGRYEVIGVRKDGTEFNAELHTQSFRKDGKTFRAVGVRDVTLYKTTQHQLEENQRKLKNIVEHSTNLFYQHDAHNKVTYMSPQVRDILGYEMEEAYLKYTDFLSNNPINEKGVALSNLAIETGQRQEPYEIELIHKSGRRVMVEVREAPILENGKTVAMVGSLTDITKRKKAEKKLQESQKQLEKQNQKLKKWNATVNDTNIMLKKANSELDSFVYRVSHDLRAPISSSLGLVNLASNSDDLATLKKYFNLLGQSLYKLDNFIKDILNYSRNARMDIIPQLLDLENMVQEVVAEQMSSVRYIPAIQANCQVMSDDLRLRIILNNLISNSYKYYNPAIEDPWVKINIETSKKWIDISIEDNGIGIRSELQPRVFDMFFRATQSAKGSGLGLYIVKDCIERLEGEINLDSKPGEGTRIALKIPNLLQFANSSPETDEVAPG